MLAAERQQTKNTLAIFFLDSDKNLISLQKQNLLQLTANMSDIFVPACYLDAKYIIIAMLVPKRRTQNPTAFEQRQVQKIYTASKFFNINLLDYLLISKNKYYSFHEAGVLQRL